MRAVNRNKGITSNYLRQALIPMFFILLFCKYYLGKDKASIQNLFASLNVVLGMLMTFIYFVKIKREPYIFVFLFTLCLFGLFSAIFGENYRLQDIALLFTYMGVSLIPFYIKLNFKLYAVLYYSLIIFFVYHIIIGTHRDDIFSTSGNFISELLLIAMGYHVISAKQNNKRPHLLLFIASLGVVIWAYGRSGILVFSTLLLAYPFIVDGKKNFRIFMPILFFIIILLLSFYFYDDIVMWYEYSRFTQKGYEAQAREIIREQYWHETTSSFTNFILGTPLNLIPQVVSLNLNPHNSFIRLHTLYGFGGFILIIFSLCWSVLNYIKNKNYLFLVLFLVLLFRAFVDINAFYGPFDPLIYYLIIFSFIKLKPL